MASYHVDQLVWLNRYGGWLPCTYVSAAPGGYHIVSQACGGTTPLNIAVQDHDLSDCAVDPAAFDRFDLDIDGIVPRPAVINLSVGSPAASSPVVVDLRSPVLINLVSDDDTPLERLMVVGQQVDVDYNGTWFSVRIDTVHLACGDSDVTYDVAYGAGTFELGVATDRFRAQ